MMKVSLIVAVGLVAAALLRRGSAAIRHCVLAAAIACAAATPLLELIVPSWHVPVGAVRLGRSVGPLTLLIPLRLTSSLGASLDASLAGTVGTDSTRVAPLSVPRVLRAVWFAGAAISLSILLVGLGRLAWLASRSQRVEHGRWNDVTDRLSLVYGLRRPVRLLQSRHPTLLVTWGLRHPKVILPREAGDWPEERVRIVVGHELAHILRRDWLVQMVAELLRSIYWFNPLVWIACRRLRQESEQACDDVVLSLGVAAPDYADHLLAVARAFKGYRATVFPAPAMARPSNLERRVRAMLNDRLNRTPITPATGIAIVIALIGLTLPLAGLVAFAQTTTATFSGTLGDAVGRILPDATLVLTNVQTKEKRGARSDESGHFALSGLPAGDYQLGAQLPGFATSQGRLVLDPGEIVNRDIALQIGDIHETLMVWSTEVPQGAVRPATRAARQPDFDSCSQSTAGGCIKPPTRISDARPRYPQAHIDAGVGGNVEVAGRIGTDGFIKDLRITAPADPDFATATIEALRQWQFTSTRLDGVPVETNIRVTAHFVAQ